MAECHQKVSPDAAATTGVGAAPRRFPQASALIVEFGLTPFHYRLNGQCDLSARVAPNAPVGYCEAFGEGKSCRFPPVSFLFLFFVSIVFQPGREANNQNKRRGPSIHEYHDQGVLICL